MQQLDIIPETRNRRFDYRPDKIFIVCSDPPAVLSGDP
jgi:hypothetical protein